MQKFWGVFSNPDEFGEELGYESPDRFLGALLGANWDHIRQECNDSRYRKLVPHVLLFLLANHRNRNLVVAQGDIEKVLLQSPSLDNTNPEDAVKRLGTRLNRVLSGLLGDGSRPAIRVLWNQRTRREPLAYNWYLDDDLWSRFVQSSWPMHDLRTAKVYTSEEQVRMVHEDCPVDSDSPSARCPVRDRRGCAASSPLAFVSTIPDELLDRLVERNLLRLNRQKLEFLPSYKVTRVYPALQTTHELIIRVCLSDYRRVLGTNYMTDDPELLDHLDQQGLPVVDLESSPLSAPPGFCVFVSSLRDRRALLRRRSDSVASITSRNKWGVAVGSQVKPFKPEHHEEDGVPSLFRAVRDVIQTEEMKFPEGAPIHSLELVAWGVKRDGIPEFLFHCCLDCDSKEMLHALNAPHAEEFRDFRLVDLNQGLEELRRLLFTLDWEPQSLVLLLELLDRDLLQPRAAC